MLRKLRGRFVLLAVGLTWLVGGVVAILGYRQLTIGIRREAMVRVENAVRSGWEIVGAEFDRLDPLRLDPISCAYLGVRRFEMTVSEAEEHRALNTLFDRAERSGRSKGFVLLNESVYGGIEVRDSEEEAFLEAIQKIRGPEGLCMVSIVAKESSPTFVVAVRPLRLLFWLPDRIRDIALGGSSESKATATVTIFEGPVRIATNVRLEKEGRRAIATTVSDEVADRVLVRGKPWKDRAWVVDRWVISYYEPIFSPDKNVIGMLYAGLDEAPYVVEGERSIVVFLASILALGVVVSGLAWYVGGSLTRPLSQLTSAVDALGRGEHGTIEVPRRATEEIRVLSETFNSMSHSVTTKAEALEASRKQAQEALDDYMEVLAFVAHELKSPISGALSQMMLIEAGYAGEVPDKLRRPMAAIRRYLDYGKEMALGFNNLSRAETEGFSPKKQHVSDFEKEIVQPAIQDFSEAASQNHMSISCHADLVSAEVDPGLMRTVMDNLIGNAVKYGKEGTTIRVAVKSSNESISVSVRNEGVGVPKERFSDLFVKFSRIHDESLKSKKGTGVGLYLVKRIIGIHGGRVDVNGEYGSWIEFSFDIPV